MNLFEEWWQEGQRQVVQDVVNKKVKKGETGERHLVLESR